MKKLSFSVCISFFCLTLFAGDFTSDVFKTSEGDLKITFIGHGTLMFEFDGKVIHVDPWSRLADYSELPDADIILITHHHGDHLDMNAINEIRKKNSEVVMTQTCSDQLEDFEAATIMKNGDKHTIEGMLVEALPAYNIEHTRPDGQPFHPKGIGNAYVLNLGDARVLIGGDTENVPEIKELKNISIAFLPMNLPYTMTPEMVADAARAIQPDYLYPCHFGKTETGKLAELLKDEKEIELRIRALE